ncbi:MAG: SUMF1/EgtB/PvdO family nonheme iron enzyme [Planctomycetes bacterium]|nr:SUMF1/EgtB/PvdO family nonheme iron enzyme [Planctomycetota bacterium]MBL7040996.1 SUMF1/EgtB/PvdO family nonheme iron enzyme [Pirellulaceae bacterium]
MDGHRLPTVGEWLAAYRGGRTRSDPAHATVAANSAGKTQPVGSSKPNALGIHDMTGNVYCLDAKAGGKKWEHATGGAVVSSPGQPTVSSTSAATVGAFMRLKENQTVVREATDLSRERITLWAVHLLV